MLGLSNLFNKFKKRDIAVDVSNEATESINKINSINIYFDTISMKVLEIEKDIDTSAETVLWSEERFFGPYENLSEGEPVRNIQNAVERALSEMQHRLEGKKNIQVSLPYENVFIKNIQILNIEQKEILLQAEIKKYIPIPFSEIMLAKNQINIDGQNRLMYFCVAIQKNIFDKYMSIFKNFGINPYLEISFFSITRFIEAIDNDKYNVLFYIDEIRSMVILCKGKVIISIEKINLGSQNIYKNLAKELDISQIDAKLLIEKVEILESEKREIAKVIRDSIFEFNKSIALEITQAHLSFEKYFDLDISNLYLTGDYDFKSINKIIESELKNNLNIKIIDNKNLNRYTHNLGIAKR
jgi:hypothetical protein